MSDVTFSFGNGGMPADNGGDLVKDTTTATFAADVLEASRQQPVLVDFWAPWCGPCKTLGPVIEKAVRDAGGGVKLVKMNIDDHPEVAGQLRIQSIPAVLAFVDGKAVDGFIGALPESQVKAFIKRIADAGGKGGPSVDDILDEAEAQLQAGNVGGAIELYSAVLSASPEDVRALAGLAQAALAEGNLDQAKEVLAAVPEAKRADPAVSAAQAKLDLAEQAASLGDTAPLEARIAANPADFEARFELALAMNALGNREGATDQLLEILRKDRNWSEEKARKQLLQFFEAWGPMDEATLSGRRRLSSLLFA